MSFSSDPKRSLFLRLATEQLQREEEVESRYDDQAAELFLATPQGWTAAADLTHGGPRTKKFDIERGEDLKGTW